LWTLNIASQSYPLTLKGFIKVASDVSVVVCWCAILLKGKFSAQCFAEFCGDRVNCFNTITEETGPVAVQKPPKLLPVHIMHCTIDLKFVTIACNCYSCWRFCCTFNLTLSFHFSHFFQISSIAPGLSCIARKTPLQPPFCLPVLQFDKMAGTIL
jgi:hypothetical protein